MRGEKTMLSTSTSNSSFLNGNIDENYSNMDDRMAILDCETRHDDYHKPISRTRRIAFVASIVSTVLVIIVFLLLPCNRNCVAKHQITKFTKTINWMKTYDNIEFKGNINTPKSNADDLPVNLIFMYRNDKSFINYDSQKYQKSNGGIIKINGNSGQVLWKNEMTNEPRSIDCGLIDCNKSGKNDCLVIDDYGQLACFDESGHWIYYNSDSKTTKIDQKREIFDFPLIVPDLTGDGVYEIVMASYKGNASYLTLISGSNGKLLAQEILNCLYLERLQLDADYMIKFICVSKNNTEQQIFKNLINFYESKSKKPVTNKFPAITYIPQHKYFEKLTILKTQTTTIKVLDKELKIENKGVWPRESKTTLKLTSTKKGVKTTHYNYSANKMYAFTPIKFSLNITSIKGLQNEEIHGFIVKFWIWNGTEINYNVKTKHDDDRNFQTPENNFTNQTYNNAYTTKIRYLKESILLIVFNSTCMKTENTSQSNIVQFCHNYANTTNGDAKCQPDLKYQEDSMIIADIDNDGSKELISYYSTFIDENQSDNILNAKWKLKTFLQLFKLETELPKLYGGEYDIF